MHPAFYCSCRSTSRLSPISCLSTLFSAVHAFFRAKISVHTASQAAPICCTRILLYTEILDFCKFRICMFLNPGFGVPFGPIAWTAATKPPPERRERCTRFFPLFFFLLLRGQKRITYQVGVTAMVPRPAQPSSIPKKAPGRAAASRKEPGPATAPAMPGA